MRRIYSVPAWLPTGLIVGVAEGVGHLLVDCLTNRLFCGNINLVVLDGELAVPCTRNPP